MVGARTVQQHLGSEGARRGNLDVGRSFGHDDQAFDAEAGRMVADSLRMVARTAANHTCKQKSPRSEPFDHMHRLRIAGTLVKKSQLLTSGAFFRRELKNFVQCATLLVLKNIEK